MGTCPRSALSSAGDPRLYADEHAAALKLQPLPETPSSMCPRGLLGSSATTWKSSIAALTWPASASRMALSRRLVVAVRRGARLLLGFASDAPRWQNFWGGGFSRDQARQGPTSNVPKGSWLRVRKKRNARCALRKA